MGKDKIIYSECIKEEKMDLEEALKNQLLKAEGNKPIKDTDEQMQRTGECVVETNRREEGRAS